MVFGTFDILHDGHRFFLREAKKLGDRLIAVVATDKSVEILKKRKPINTLAQRINNLGQEKIADVVTTGDEILNSWQAITKFGPTVIAAGYDQTTLRNAVENFVAKKNLPTRLVVIKPYADKTLHSSKFRNNL